MSEKSSKPHDVYSYGMISSSLMCSLENPFPAPEGYAEIKNTHRMTGGEAANSSMVLARLGVQVRLDGNWLGDDDSGKTTKHLLEKNRIDVSRLKLKKGYKGVLEIVFADNNTRTIFGTYGHLLKKEEWNKPIQEDILKTKIVNVDPFFKEESYRVSKIAFDRNIPVVTVDCKYDDRIAKNVSVLIVAESFLKDHYRGIPYPKLIKAYQQHSSGLIIFTLGEKDILYGKKGEPVKHFKPFQVAAIDTIGGGDSFRAGIVFGLLKKWDEEKTISFAAKLAAIVCTRTPGVLNSPSYQEVMMNLAKEDVRDLKGLVHVKSGESVGLDRMQQVIRDHGEASGDWTKQRTMESFTDIHF